MNKESTSNPNHYQEENRQYSSLHRFAFIYIHEKYSACQRFGQNFKKTPCRIIITYVENIFLNLILVLILWYFKSKLQLNFGLLFWFWPLCHLQQFSLTFPRFDSSFKHKDKFIKNNLFLYITCICKKLRKE